MGLDSISNRDPYEDLERHDLLTGEPRYIEDEIRNSNLAMAFGGAALVFQLVAMILTWILYYRERTRTFLWHAIWLIVGLLFAGACAAWGAGAAGAVRSGRQPGAIFTGVVFIGSLIFVAYHLIEAVWLVLYRPVHFDYLVGLKTDQNLWDSRMKSGSSFTDGWIQDRRMIWWVTLFTVLSALCFAFIAYAARSVVWNRYNLVRWTLAIGLLAVTIFSFLVIYWVQEAYNFQAALPGQFGGNLLTLAKIFAIVSLVLAVLNAIANLIQSRVGYFVIGAIQCVLIFILICIAGLLLRQVWAASFSDVTAGGQGSTSCISTMISIHENEFSSFCPNGSKYISGTPCSKSFLVTRWENQNENANLNPGCCSRAKFYYLYPFMLVGYWLLFLIFATAIVAASNLYLSDANEYLSNANKSASLPGFLALALVLLALIAWGIYFWARKANTVSNGQNNSQAAFLNPTNKRISGFDLVPQTLEFKPTKATQSEQVVLKYAGNTIPTFNTGATCGDANTCTERLALLTNQGTFKITTGSGVATRPVDKFDVFFPGCTAKTDYLFVTGTNAQLTTFLNGLTVVPATGLTSADVLVFNDQQKTADLQQNGLLASETSGTGSCGTGYSGNTCNGPCKMLIPLKAVVATENLVGRFFYIDSTGSQNNDVGSNIVCTLFDGNSQISGVSFALLVAGQFTFTNVPRYETRAYTATARCNDITTPKSRFLDRNLDIYIPRIGGGVLSAGNIRLLTSNGQVCSATDATCLNAQTQSTGSVTVAITNGTDVTNGNSPTPLANTQVTLFRGQTAAAQQIQSLTTDANGKVTFTNAPYDAYTIVASKDGFKDSSIKVEVQKAATDIGSLVMGPTAAGLFDMMISSKVEDSRVDLDLHLRAESDKNAGCTVSPYNKYCAYSAHANDVAQGVGQESIVVRRLSVANYASWVAPAPAYGASCDAGSNYYANAGAYHADWNWLNTQKTVSLTSIRMVISTVVPTTPAAAAAEKAAASSPVAAASAPTIPPPVETTEQSAQPKTVLSFNGKSVPEGTTLRTSKNTELPAVLATPNNSTAANNTTAPVANNTTAPVANNTTTPDANNTTTPAANNTTTPAANNTTTPAANNTTTPAANNTTAPAANNTTAPAAANNTTAPAANNTTAPVANNTTAPAAANNTTAPAANNTTAPAANNTTAPAAANNTTAPAANNTTAPAANNTTAPAAANNTTAPAANNTTSPAAANNTTAPAANNTTADANNTTAAANNTTADANNTTAAANNTTAAANNTTSDANNTTNTSNNTTAANNSSANNSSAQNNTSSNASNNSSNASNSSANNTSNSSEASNNTSNSSNNTSANAAASRRLLSEVPRPKHFQGTNSAAASPNVIFVNCFNGWGPISLVNVNDFRTTVPPMSECISKIAAATPQYTLETLRAKYNTWAAANPTLV
jgi:Carboxypeptidase regulatory-like domain